MIGCNVTLVLQNGREGRWWVTWDLLLVPMIFKSINRILLKNLTVYGMPILWKHLIFTHFGSAGPRVAWMGKWETNFSFFWCLNLFHWFFLMETDLMVCYMPILQKAKISSIQAIWGRSTLGETAVKKIAHHLRCGKKRFLTLL